jgi:hypothetical protein
MSPEEVVQSIGRHFSAGCSGLDAFQLREHEAAGICQECATLERQAEYERYAYEGPGVCL